MKRIFLTGGSGFIGLNLCLSLLEQGHEILFIDIVKPRISTLERYWQKCDILDFELLKETISTFKPDTVIHLAARTDLNGKILSDYSPNIKGVSNLLEVLKVLKGLERVIFFSSMYVCEPGYKPESDNDYKPHTVYGESKVLTERIIKEMNPTNYCWCIVRPTSIWGPYFAEPYKLFFMMIMKHKYFHMGKKACSKTYGYVDNLNYQVVELIKADADKVFRNIFYLGDYEPYSITEWADEISHFFNIKIYHIPFFIFELLAFTGDFLKKFKLKFPMTSFRLKNMTTNNIYDLDKIKKIAPVLPVSRKEGTFRTVNWLKSESSI